MNSQPKTDADELSETQRTAIALEARLASLVAAVYFLIAAVLLIGGAHIVFAFPGEIQAEFRSMDSLTRQMVGWSKYLPPAAFAIGAYYLIVEDRLRRRLIQKPVSRP